VIGGKVEVNCYTADDQARGKTVSLDFFGDEIDEIRIAKGDRIVE
jgi:hypothetical protein